MVQVQIFVAITVASLWLFAADIAVIDSGLDYRHRDLVSNIWINGAVPVQSLDIDGKKYVDDVHGWNFAENNNQIIDYKYLGTFSDDCFKIFHVQVKVISNTATEEERAWYKAKKEDKVFLKELQKFGNFVHGTHVSGISSDAVEQSRLISLKIIPTEVPGASALTRAEEFRSRHGLLGKGADNPLVKLFLSQLAKRQTDFLITVGKYVRAVKAKVANGSFGTSVPAVIPVIKPLLAQLLGHEPTDEEARSYAIYFVGEIVTLSKNFAGASVDTLFVFAAGNDSGDNDRSPVSPANIKSENTIAVAATLGRQSLALFSNYGARMVEVAAPGVGIESTIPGDLKLPMSGTSMAAPYVTRVAGQVKDANPSLTPANIKQILIETVDPKPFLVGKVTSGGIVNPDRAVYAAERVVKLGLRAAIVSAKAEVKDVRDVSDGRLDGVDGPPTVGDFSDLSDLADLIVVPLPLPAID